MDDVCETWQSLNHRQGADGHLRTGLANSIFGEDDHWITREAKTFWDENNTQAWRTAEVKRSESLAQKGEAHWTKDFIYKKLVEPFDANVGGISAMDLEGDVLEKPVERDAHGMVEGAPWRDAPVNGACEDVSSDSDSGEDAGDHCISGTLVPKQSADTPLVVAHALTQAARLANLEHIANKARDAGAYRLMWHSQSEAQKLMKRQQVGKHVSSQSDSLFARFLEKRAEERKKELEASRKETEAKKAKLKEEAANIEKKNLKNTKLKLKNERLKLKLAHKRTKAVAKQEKADRANNFFTKDECGQGQANGGNATHLRNRVLLLQKLKEAAPPLPPGLDAAWPYYRNWWAEEIGKTNGAAAGHFLFKSVEAVLQALGLPTDLIAKSGAKKPGSAIDERAFEKYAKWVYDRSKKAADPIMFA